MTFSIVARSSEGTQFPAHEAVEQLTARDDLREQRQVAMVDADGGGSDVLVDLRADDHETPVDELVRLLALHELYFGKPDPADLHPLEGGLAAEVSALLATLGYDRSDLPLDERLFDWMGWENYEERHVPGHIDVVVLLKLREAAEAVR